MTDPSLIPADVVRAVPEGRVVYGMQLPIQSQSTLYVADWEKEAGPDELARIARVADEAGFFYIGVCDHTAIPRRLADAMGTIWYDTTATLGWLAALTTRTHLLSHVLILAQRHPLRAAKELSTLDRSRVAASSWASAPGTCPRSTSCSPATSTNAAATPTRPSPRWPAASPTSSPSCPGPRFPPRTWGWRRARCASPARPSGSAAPRRRPSAAPRPSATAGSPRARAGATCRARSPACASCGPSCAAVPRSTSAPSSSRST